MLRLRAYAAPAALLVALGALGACGGGDDPASGDPTPTGAGATAGFGNDPDTRAALGVVEAYYAAVARADCTTMRGISTPDAQADDAVWAGCGDALVELAGAGFTYEVSGGSVEGDTASFEVAVMQDAGDRTDPVGLVREDGAWLVDSSVLTDG